MILLQGAKEHRTPPWIQIRNKMNLHTVVEKLQTYKGFFGHSYQNRYRIDQWLLGGVMAFVSNQEIRGLSPVTTKLPLMGL